jgi:imidazolonepropionase-like amidohydrolase
MEHAARMTTLRAARLFDGERFVDAPVVVLDGDAIVRVGGPDDGDVVDLGDVTLMPGLIDAHQHLVFNGTGTLEEQVVGYSDDELRDRARANAQRALAAGITTLRDLGDRNFVTLGLRNDPKLPTILAAGPPLTIPGGHCWFLGGECADLDAAIAAVHERHARGCDVVKIMVTGGGLTPTTPMWESQFGGSDMAAIVDAAHTLGLPVAAHCHGHGGILDAIDAGVDTIEHCTFFAESGRVEPDADTLARIAKQGITISATVGRDRTQPVPPFVTANYDTMVGAMRGFVELGGKVVVGTDAGVGPAKPHDILPAAVVDLTTLGLERHEILATLTARAAAAVGAGDRKGRLAPGYDADLAAFGDDALLDVRAVWRAGVRVV